MSAESFTVLAILEARDRASEIFAKVDESLDKFSETAGRAADVAKGSADSIDDSLLKTASGADALDVASARVNAAQERAARSAEAQADAERNLLEVHRATAGAADDDAAAQYRLMEADERMTAAAKENAAAQKTLAGAQKLQADTAKAAAAASDENAASQDKVKESSGASAIGLGSVGKVAGIMALGMGVAGALMVKAAGDFQDSTEHLVTDAGESQSKLAMVRAGILQVSTATGQSAESITEAMYHVESSGFHAATGLAILKTAAQGARVGGADLDTTSKALVGTLTAYYGTSLTAAQATKDSTSLMNQLVETVGSGDMRMQDLASSLSAVTPIAAAAHLSFAQVGGAIATMTAQGMTAQQATQDLANMIRNTIHPNATAAAEMKALGLNANTVSSSLSKNGLTGTLQLYTDAILKNTHGGGVMLGYMKEMTPAAQGLARGILDGKLSTYDLTQAVKQLNPQQAAIIEKFKTAATSATGLKQTYGGAMAAMTGGATGLNVALMLSGKHMKTFTDNTAAVAAKARDASGNVKGWSDIQSTFNFKLASAKVGIENTGIAIGSALLPAATALIQAVVRVVEPIAAWTASHQHLTAILFAGVTAIAATIAVIALATKAFKAVKGAVDSVKATVGAAQKALQKLGLISKESADTQAASAKKAASAQEKASEDSAAASDEAAGEQEADAETVAAANDEAATESSGSWLAAAGAQIAAGAQWAAQAAVKIATVTAGYVVSAAQAVAAWAVAAGSMIAQGAVWVGATIAKVAVIVGANIAGAVATAAAWVVANATMLLGIGLIVAAVAAAVYLIVSHWSEIVAGVKKAWNAVYSFIHKVITDVISFVKSHWQLIVGLVAGPLVLAVVEVVRHWDAVKKFISKAVTDVIDFVKSHWRLIITILGGPLGLAVALVTKYWGDITGFFSKAVGTVMGIVGKLGGDMLSVGKNIVMGIWNGISGAAGWLTSHITGFASNVLGDIGSAFGIGSPSKYTHVHGFELGRGLGNGFVSSLSYILASVKRVSGAVLQATSGIGGAGHGIGSTLAASATLSAVPASGSGGTGGPVVNVYVTGNYVMSNADADMLAAKVGNRLATQILPAAGRKVPYRG